MDKLETVFKALGDQTRLRMMNVLLKQELCVCEIMEALDLPQSKTSRHLGILRDAGIVLDRRDDQMVFYRVNTAESSVQTLLEPLAILLYQAYGQDDLQRLETILSERVNLTHGEELM